MAEVKELRELINLVVEARGAVKEATELRTSEYQKWLRTNQHLFDFEDNTKTACQEAEDSLRFLALETYAATGEKTVAPGIGIREVTKYSYSETEALKWAIEHKMALKLDETKFKNHVKADPPDFVTVTTEPQATIATELQKVE